MANDDIKNPMQSAIFWPAEWAVERAFWREVATRTIAGVLTILIIGVPTLVWAAISGALRWSAVAPIIVGLALFGIVIAIYAFVIVRIRRKEAKKIADALDFDYSSLERLFVGESPRSLSTERQQTAFDALSKDGQTRARTVVEVARRQSRHAVLAATVALVAGLVGVLLGLPAVLDGLDLTVLVGR